MHTNQTKHVIKGELCHTHIKTPLGTMIAIADTKGLYLLEFENKKNLEHELEQFKQKLGVKPVHKQNVVLEKLKQELEAYFQGTRQTFTTPVHFVGTPFQKQVWKMLQKIPHGQTWSYQELAQNLGRPTAFRAAAGANSKNRVALVVPCHRVINKNGKLGGYAGGLGNKQSLLTLEQQT